MKKGILFLVLSIIIEYLWIPNLIHFINKSLTDEQVILDKKEEYWQLAEGIHFGKIVDNSKNREVLYKLYLWFHIRGLPIDEGHEPITTYEKWRELIEFYSNKE